MISDQPTVAGIIFGVQALIGVFGLTAIAVLLIRRWRSASLGDPPRARTGAAGRDRYRVSARGEPLR